MNFPEVYSATGMMELIPKIGFLPKHMDASDQSIARSLSRTAVVRITLTEPPTGKRKQYDKEGVEMKYGRME